MSLPRTLKIEQSPSDKTATIIQRTDTHDNKFPLLSFTSSDKSIQLYRIGAGTTILQPTPIGNATIHTFSLNIDLNWNGQQKKLKSDGLDFDWKLEDSPIGKMKWKASSSSSHKVVDSSGNKIAGYKSRSKDTRLEILVPCDDQLLDLIVLCSIGVVKMLKKDSKTWEMGEEIMEAVFG